MKSVKELYYIKFSTLYIQKFDLSHWHFSLTSDKTIAWYTTDPDKANEFCTKLYNKYKNNLFRVSTTVITEVEND